MRGKKEKKERKRNPNFVLLYNKNNKEIEEEKNYSSIAL